MNRDQALGAAVLVASLIAVIVYGWLLFLVAPQLLLQLTAFVAVAGVLGILAWIGWVMATTPPPPPLEMEPTPTPAQQEPEQARSEGKSKKKTSG